MQIPELKGLRRRWRFIMQELYRVEEQIAADRSHNQGIGYTLNYKEELEEELNDLDFVFQFFNRQRNGYHLTPSQWVMLAVVAGFAATVAYLIARGA